MSITAWKLPWYLKPGWYWGGLVLLFAVNSSVLASPNSTLGEWLAPISVALAAFYFSWPYLLYNYLAPHTPDRTRHSSGRNKIPLLIILLSLLLILPLNNMGLNTPEPNEPVDLIAIPLVISIFFLNWSACDLLVSIEQNAGQKRGVSTSFFAMLYLPLSIVWFHSRLVTLKRLGKI